MDALALLCNLHAEGPETLRRLRGAGVTDLASLGRLSLPSLESALGRGDGGAQRFLREASLLAERLGRVGPGSAARSMGAWSASARAWPAGTPEGGAAQSTLSPPAPRPEGWAEASPGRPQILGWGDRVPVEDPGTTEPRVEPRSADERPEQAARPRPGNSAGTRSASGPEPTSPISPPAPNPHDAASERAGTVGGTAGGLPPLLTEKLEGDAVLESDGDGTAPGACPTEASGEAPVEAEDTALTEPEVGRPGGAGAQGVLAALLRAWQRSEAATSEVPASNETNASGEGHPLTGPSLTGPSLTGPKLTEPSLTGDQRTMETPAPQAPASDERSSTFIESFLSGDRAAVDRAPGDRAPAGGGPVQAAPSEAVPGEDPPGSPLPDWESGAEASGAGGIVMEEIPFEETDAGSGRARGPSGAPSTPGTPLAEIATEQLGLDAIAKLQEAGVDSLEALMATEAQELVARSGLRYTQLLRLQFLARRTLRGRGRL